jgi:hypothetical protein
MLALVNLILSSIAILGCYLGPMYFVGHWYARSIFWLGLAVATILALKYTWYRSLPAPGNDAD